MPHRPQEQGSTTIVNGGDTTLYTPPRVPGTAAASIMRQTSGTVSSTNQTIASSMYGGAARSSAGVVTPLVGGSKLWLNSGNMNSGNTLNQHHHETHMPSLEARNKSTDSTDRSAENASHDATSVATLTTEDDREATASALLMVAKAAEREHMNSMILAASIASGVTSSSSAMPLKKRKQQLDILCRQGQKGEDPEENDDEEEDNEEADTLSEAMEKDVHSSMATTGAATTTAEHDPCHVSPVSHSSAEHGLRTESTDDSTPTRRIIPHNRGNRTGSYDSKDLPSRYGGATQHHKNTHSTQELLDSAKVFHAAQIGAPKTYLSQVLIPHFPTVLHQVLADKEFDGKVVQWLPDGEAWMVLRWDALRRQILPRYFADLRDENGSGCGTIDAFLFHLGAWGFEEIKDGTAMGAYRHDLFIRGAQKLCVKMRFTADSVGVTKGPMAVSPHGVRSAEAERSMLQVPSLNTMESKMPPHKRARCDGPSNGLIHWPYGDSQRMWGSQFHSDTSHVYGIRTSAPLGGQYHSPPFNAEPRMALRRSSTPESLPSAHQYTPPQVRSGRGAMRVAIGIGRRVSSPSTTPVVRPGISVSNRGKGPRKPAACRPNVATSPSTVPIHPSSTSEEHGQTEAQSSTDTVSEAQRIGSSVQVAIAISRKTKRKLPMAGKRLEDTADFDPMEESKSCEEPFVVTKVSEPAV